MPAIPFSPAFSQRPEHHPGRLKYNKTTAYLSTRVSVPIQASGGAASNGFSLATAD